MKNNQFNLTNREMEVLRLIVCGYNNSEIAGKLFITVHTSKAHVGAILQKLNEKNRTKAALKAIKCGLIAI